MYSRLNTRCLDVLHASNIGEFKSNITRFVQDLGFGTVAATVITDHSPTLTEFQMVTNAPDAFLSEFEDLEMGRIDPISQHCKRSRTPIVWDRTTYVAQQVPELWERQAQFGLRSGLAVAMHLGRGRHFMFGAEWNYERCDQVKHYKDIFEDLLTFAAHAQAAAFELSLSGNLSSKNSSLLTRHELETLRRTMDGWTSWEVGDAMCISERHATLLMRRAMKKLDCGTKYEAVLRAIKLGLIECA